MKNWKMSFVVSLLILGQILAACAPAATPTAAPTEAAPPESTEAPPEPTVEPSPTTPPEPVDIELWAQATVTEASGPPDDWVAYDIIREELNINLTYVIVPTGEDGEAKLNAAAAANDLPDLFQIVDANNDARGALKELVDLGLVAPVEDLMPLIPERVKTHYNDQLLIDLVTWDAHQYGDRKSVV